jgi:mono/diheme cytochrome c family protein
LALAVSVGIAAAWWSKPRTPEALYRARCAACHALPDLSRFTTADMAGIVATMRARNGADAVIDEEEARVIVRYLEKVTGQ